jgi:hypothetical protein
MKTKRFLTKGQLLIAFLAFVLANCRWDESTPVVDRVRTTVTNTAEAVPTHDVDAADARNVDAASSEIFGDVKIKSSEYLYNLDDSPDYIYVDFTDYGYAVYFKDTMELMEYAPWGNLPYPETRARRYYGGPTNYFNKEDEQWVNTVTKESVYVTRTEAETYSRQVVELFSKSSAERAQARQISSKNYAKSDDSKNIFLC